MADEDPEGAIEEEVRREGLPTTSVFQEIGPLDVDSADAGLQSWRAMWENASDEQRGQWYRRGYVDQVGDVIADALRHRPENSTPEGDHRRVLDFGEVGSGDLDGYRLVVTVALQTHKPGMRGA